MLKIGGVYFQKRVDIFGIDFFLSDSIFKRFPFLKLDIDVIVDF